MPLCLTRLDTDEELELADGVRIEPLSEAAQRARAVGTVYLNLVSPYLVAAATHAVVVDNVVIANDPAAHRRIALEIVDGTIDLKTVDRVIEAFHVATGRQTGYAQLCLRSDDWADGWKADLPNLESVRTLRRFPPSFAEGGWNKPQEAVGAEQLASLPAIYQSLSDGPPRVKLAARRSLSASMRTDRDDALIDACIGIEALLGQQTDEITHRLAQRAAVALTLHEPATDPEVIYRLAKAVYSQRSTVVHGAADQKRKAILVGGRSASADNVAQDLLRRLLASWATHHWTPGTLDGALLDRLRRPDGPERR